MSFDSVYNFIAVDKFSAAIKTINKNVSKFKENLSKASAAASKVNKTFNKIGGQLSLKVGAPLILIGRKVLKTAADFQSSMNMLQAVTGASSDQMAKFRQQAMLVGQTTIFTARQAANAQVAMAKAGANTNEILAGMPANARAAAAAQQDLGSMAKITAGALHSVGLNVKDLDHLSDLLSATSNATLTNMQDLGTSFRLVGARAKLAGIPLNETVAMMGQIVQSGIPAQQAARLFSQALVKMLKPSSMGKKILKTLNLEFTNAAGKMKPLVPIIQKLQKLQEKGILKPAGFQELFGTRGSTAIGNVVTEGSKALQDLLESLSKVDGTTKKMADTQMQGLPGALKRLAAAFEHIQLVVERTNNTFATQFIETITKTTLWISKLNPNIQRIIVEFGAFLTILGPIFILLGKVLAVMTFLGVVTGGTALAIGGITVAVIALVAAFVLLWKKSERFRGFFQGIGRGMRGFFQGTDNVMRAFFPDYFKPATMATPAAPPAMSFAPGRLNEPQLVKSLLNINVKDNAGFVKNISGTSDSDHFEMNTGLNMSLAR